MVQLLHNAGCLIAALALGISWPTVISARVKPLLDGFVFIDDSFDPPDKIGSTFAGKLRAISVPAPNKLGSERNLERVEVDILADLLRFYWTIYIPPGKIRMEAGKAAIRQSYPSQFGDLYSCPTRRIP